MHVKRVTSSASFFYDGYKNCDNAILHHKELSHLLQNPGSSFLKAAKSGVVDNLQGNLDALAWGNCLPMGTSGQFDIIYSEKVREHYKFVDVYGLLEARFDQMDQEIKTP
ncbi:DNA-directed RNA polymerase [Trifolium repens]|nr:DNA-directed RNA polymerase [Trifolium repens]